MCGYFEDDRQQTRSRSRDTKREMASKAPVIIGVKNCEVCMHRKKIWRHPVVPRRRIFWACVAPATAMPILRPNAARAEKLRAKTALAEKHPSPVTGMVV